MVVAKKKATQGLRAFFADSFMMFHWTIGYRGTATSVAAAARAAAEQWSGEERPKEAGALSLPIGRFGRNPLQGSS